MENHKLLAKIESTIPFLSKTEQKIAEYILANPKKVLDMTTSKLSSILKVSEPSIIRFTRKLGLAGYTDFKIMLSAEFVSNPIDTTPVKIDLGDNALDIYNKLATFTISSIESTAATLDPNDLETAANYIYVAAKQKHQIFLSGMGASTVLIKEFQIKMMRVNIQTTFFEDYHLRFEACANLKENDLFICFTTLGSSIENYELIDLASSKNAKIIVITQFGNRKITEKADIALFTSVIENNLRIASQTAIVLQSMVVDALFLTIALKDYDEIANSVNEFKQQFKKLGHIL